MTSCKEMHGQLQGPQCGLSGLDVTSGRPQDVAGCMQASEKEHGLSGLHPRAMSSAVQTNTVPMWQQEDEVAAVRQTSQSQQMRDVGYSSCERLQNVLLR